MSETCGWCDGGDGWPPESKDGLCGQCMIEWERDKAVGLLRRIWSWDCIRRANDQGYEDGGYPSDELSRDRAAVEAFLEETP